ncbi:MAG: 23S rRNA (uracil(1939)-C(5))-methyltransferase RlmD [Flavobacteriales bacterium]|nr:23S rRNA (uracil(1939)-C(5))-methyltransferase RlmD [Flavobacteriales bacterium]
MAKKKHPLYEQVSISDTGNDGLSVGKHNGMAVFVKNAVPGDVVDIQIVKKKRNYAEGRAVKFHTYSPDRVAPECKHFGLCGGCTRQDLSYEKQLEFKQKVVFDCFTRIGHLTFPEISPILPSENQFYYRNKMDFGFTASRWVTTEEMDSGSEVEERRALGFHVPGMFDKIFNVTECLLQPEPSNQIRNGLREFTLKNNIPYYHIRSHEGFMRNLIVRNNQEGQVMVIVAFAYEHPEWQQAVMHYLDSNFPQIVSLYQVVNTKLNDTLYDQDLQLYKGSPFLEEKLGDLRFLIGPKSFFQTNSRQGKRLYDITRNFAQLTGSELVYDLYTGTGTIACYVASEASKVVGVEYVPEAIEDAHKNAQLNGIENTAFFAGDMKDVLNDDFVATHGKPDVIITDPPRAGMHDDVTRKILELSPSRIVYVSCNPATQARDLAILCEKYRITKVQPVDMFPHTYHVENVVLLERNT